MYKAYGEDHLQNLSLEEIPELIYIYLIEIINKYLDKFHPIKVSNIPQSKIRPIWWDETCSKAIAQKRLALRKYKRDMTQENYIHCKQTAAQVKRMLKTAKQKSWQNYCNNLNRT